MNETDFYQAVQMLEDITPLGRIAVHGRSGSFALHNPTIEPAEMGDFEIAGQKRRHVGTQRTWSAYSVRVAKVLDFSRGQRVVQDIRGNVLTLTAPAGGQDLYREPDRGGRP